MTGAPAMSDLGAEIIASARARAKWLRQQADRIEAIADRIEYFRRTDRWLYPHEPGYGDCHEAREANARRRVGSR